MRTRMIRFVLAAVMLFGVLAFVTMPAHADGGAPFAANDKRVSPETGDRLAIYCNDDNIDVWGINALEEGFPLTTFSLAEITSTTPVTHQTPAGAVTLKLVAPPQTHWGYATFDSTALSLITDVGSQYQVTWAGGGQKSFSCTYLPLQQSAAQQAAPARQ
jgi:hypothetical protein